MTCISKNLFIYRALEVYLVIVKLVIVSLGIGKDSMCSLHVIQVFYRN